MEGDGSQDSWPRKQEANDYLKKHKILELFDNLTSQLIYNQPASPREFLVEHIEKLQRSRTIHRDYPCLFDDTNIQSVFGMLDPTGQGFISTEQYCQALETLGVKDFEKRPPGCDLNKISLDVFSREAKIGLAKSSATFAEK